MIVFSDCDLQQAVNGAAFATFVASGQTCIMGARLLIHRPLFEPFLKMLAEKASRIRLGDPFDPATQMGPVISAASRDRIARMVDHAIKTDGAKVWTGACIPPMPTPFDRFSS
jgi:acyl-CoA reductase-like NAD-dependent aldehyde dehydrogenase